VEFLELNPKYKHDIHNQQRLNNDFFNIKIDDTNCEEEYITKLWEETDIKYKKMKEERYNSIKIF
jgi:hypothetical protein